MGDGQPARGQRGRPEKRGASTECGNRTQRTAATGVQSAGELHNAAMPDGAGALGGTVKLGDAAEPGEGWAARVSRTARSS